MAEPHEGHECEAHSMEPVSPELLLYDRESNGSKQWECRRPVSCMVTNALKGFNAGEGIKDVMDVFSD